MAISFSTAGRGESVSRRAGMQPAQTINVGDVERWASVAAGGGMALLGLSRRSIGGAALALAGGALVYRGVTGHCPCYQQLGINTAQKHSPAIGVRAQHGVKVERSLTINRPADELYRYWRNLESLPRIMEHLESVRELGGNRSHWVAKGLLGSTVEWDAEIHNEREGELIAWRSLPGAQVDTAGSVHFEPAPHGRGTILRVSLKYDPPGGKVGATIANLLGDGVEEHLHEDLWRFKQFMEAGEMPTARVSPNL
jgi:uncharacterized membrane protein